MKRIIAIALTAMLMVGSTLAATNETFNGVKIADNKGKQTDARLIFNDTDKKIVINVADKEFATIPYESLDKASYDYTKKHRITQGAVVMVASLGAGAIVMMTKSKSHWLYLDFHEQSAPKSIVLRMDKGEYKNIIAAVQTHTGKSVEGFNDKNKPVTEKAETKPATPTTVEPKALTDQK